MHMYMLLQQQARQLKSTFPRMELKILFLLATTLSLTSLASQRLHIHTNDLT